MTRRWIYPPGAAHGIPAEEYEEWKAAQKHADAAFFMPDITAFMSPLDRSEISSRSQLREHERRHRVRQVGDLKSAAEFSNEHRRAESFNDRAFAGAFRAAVQKTGL